MSSENKIFIGIGIATVLIVAVGAFFMGGTPSPEKAADPVDKALLVKSDSYQTKKSGAKIDLVEFGDFQCPACGASHPVVKQLLEEYKDDVNFVFRHFPLPMHPHAKEAALVAEAAGAQGKFFEMQDLLFTNQKDWSESKNPLKEYFISYAEELELDKEKFEKDVKDKKYASRVEKDVADGNAAGANSTPTFFIDGQLQAGGLPYDQFKAKIDEAISKK